VKKLRDALEQRILALASDAVVHARRAPRAPHILSVSIPGTDAETMLMHLDLAGVATSSGSACMTGSVEPSHVLTAMGVPRDLAVAAVRFSFWKTNTMEDVEYVAEKLPGVIAKVRKVSEALGR
jgi:cysteine desulfurase